MIHGNINNKLTWFKILTVTLIVYSCKSEPEKYAEVYTKGFTNKTEYYNNSHVKCFGYKLNGFYDSTEIQYDQKGNIRYITNFKNGITIGDALEFYDNGALMTYCFMVRQDTCCIQVDYNKTGEIISDKNSMGWFFSNGDFDKIKDSVAMQIIIPKILFKKLNLYHSSDGSNYQKINLVDSKKYINDYEGNYTQISKNKFYTFLKATCVIENYSKVFIDTLYYVRRTN